MHTYTLLAIASLCLLALCSSVEALVQTARVTSHEGTAFLAKFCFREREDVAQSSGDVELEVSVPTHGSGQWEQHATELVVAWYSDEENRVRGNWFDVLDNEDSWSCEEKLKWSKVVLHNATQAQLNEEGTHYTVSFHYDRFVQIARPRFWFFVLAQCAQGFDGVQYRIHATQADWSSWNREFGVNEEGLNTMYLAFFVAFTILLGIHCYSTRQLQLKLQYLHPMLKLFLVAFLLEYLAVFLQLLHYALYSRNGMGIEILLRTGQVLDIVARCFFMLLLLLLAKGWTISREGLSHKWALVGLVASYLIVAVIALVWSFTQVDPKYVDPNQTVHALTIALTAIWLVFAAWFSVQIFAFSYRQEDNPVRKRMYLQLGLVYSVWFFLPAAVSLTTPLWDPWMREKIVASFTLGVNLLAYMVLVFLFWPSRAEEYFAIATPDILAVEHYATL